MKLPWRAGLCQATSLEAVPFSSSPGCPEERPSAPPAGPQGYSTKPTSGKVSSSTAGSNRKLVCPSDLVPTGLCNKDRLACPRFEGFCSNPCACLVSLARVARCSGGLQLTSFSLASGLLFQFLLQVQGRYPQLTQHWC